MLFANHLLVSCVFTRQVKASTMTTGAILSPTFEWLTTSPACGISVMVVLCKDIARIIAG